MNAGTLLSRTGSKKCVARWTSSNLKREQSAFVFVKDGKQSGGTRRRTSTEFDHDGTVDVLTGWLNFTKSKKERDQSIVDDVCSSRRRKLKYRCNEQALGGQRHLSTREVVVYTGIAFIDDVTSCCRRTRFYEEHRESIRVTKIRQTRYLFDRGQLLKDVVLTSWRHLVGRWLNTGMRSVLLIVGDRLVNDSNE